MINQKDELKDRVTAKRKEIESKISELKADTRAEAREEMSRLQTKLEEIQQSVSEGWDRVSDQAAEKINNWLKN